MNCIVSWLMVAVHLLQLCENEKTVAFFLYFFTILLLFLLLCIALFHYCQVFQSIAIELLIRSMLSPFQMSRNKLFNHIWCSWKNHRLIFLFWLVHSFFYIVIPKQTCFQTFKYFMIEMDRCTSTFHRCSWLLNYNPHNHFRKFMNILFDPFKAVCFIFLSKKESTPIGFILRHICKETHSFMAACCIQTNTCVHPLIVYQNKKMFYRVCFCPSLAHY